MKGGEGMGDVMGTKERMGYNEDNYREEIGQRNGWCKWEGYKRGGGG